MKHIGCLFAVTACLLSAASAQALTLNSSDYDIYSGDINGDGVNDLVFKARDGFVLIHGDVSVPLVFPTDKSSYVMTADKYGFYNAPVENNSQAVDGLSQLSGNISIDLGNAVGSSNQYAIQLNRNGAFILGGDLADAVNTHGDAGGGYQFKLAACDTGCQAQLLTLDPSYHGSEIGSLAGSFRVSESGAATYNVAIATAAGTAGVVPQISLNYSSQAGNGQAGVGWNIGGLSGISRCRQTLAIDGVAKPLTWTAEDRFCLDGQRLLVVNGGVYGAVGAEYKTEIDSFARVKSHDGAAGQPDYFTVERKDGSISYYGKSVSSKQSFYKTVGAYTFGGTLTWAISRFQDSVGNPIDYHYINDSDGHRVKSIDFAFGFGSAPSAKIEFQYEDRDDKNSGYVSGFQYKIGKRLNSISSSSNGELLRVYKLSYNESGADTPIDNLSRISSIQECASDNICLNPTKFVWNLRQLTTFSNEDKIMLHHEKRGEAQQLKQADLNGDGKVDLIWLGSYRKASGVLTAYSLYYAIADDNGAYLSSNVKRYPVTFDASVKKIETLDFNVDGKQDLMMRRSGRWFLFSLNDAGVLVESSETFPFSSEKIVFADLDSDGLPDATDGSSYYLLKKNSQPDGSVYPYSFQSEKALEHEYEVCFFGCPTLDFRTVGDVNGDGLSDFYVKKSVNNLAGGASIVESIKFSNLGDSGNIKLRYFSTGDAALGVDDDNARIIHVESRLGDINGDGLSDMLTGTVDGWRFRLSKGTQFSESSSVVIASSSLADANEKSPQLVDYNSDGFLDILWSENGEMYGKLWESKISNYGAQFHVISGEQGRANFFMDHNGDHSLDFLVIHKDYLKRYLGSSGRVGHVMKITNGLGAETHIEYQRINGSSHYTGVANTTENACSYRCALSNPFKRQVLSQSLQQTMPFSPIIQLNGPMYVATKVESSAPVEGDLDAKSSISYFYQEAKIQAAGRGMLGFRKLTTVDDQTGIATTTEYRQDWPFIGYPLKTTVASQKEGGTVLSEASNSWELKGFQSGWPATAKNNGSKALGALKPYIKTSVEKSFDLQTGAPLQIVTTTNQYDDYGNPLSIQVVTSNGDSSESFTKTTVNQYQGSASGLSNADAARLGRLSATTVTSSRIGDSSTRVSGFYYYTPGEAGTLLTHGGSGKAGLLKKETIEPGGDQSERLTSTHYYDLFGNKTHIKSDGHDGVANVTRWGARSQYDTYGRYVDKTYQRFAGLGNVEHLSSQVLSRNKYGAVTQARNEISGAVVATQYNSMGRQFYSVSNPGGWSRQKLQANDGYCPAGTAYMAYAEAADGSQSRECFDVLGRSTRKLARNHKGHQVASDVYYDELGRVVKKSEPYFWGAGSTAGSKLTTIEYDILGRVTKTTMPDGSIGTMSYSGYQTVSTNHLNHTKTEIKNALGELVKVIDNIGGEISYQYDSNGNLTKMIDPGNNQSIIHYDDLGRKDWMDDPDKGRWEYVYNAFGELIEQTDAKGQKSAMVYDLQGRMVQRVDKLADNTVEQTTNWVYDTASHASNSKAGLGQLHSVNDSNGYSQTAHYDQYGRALQADTVLPGLSGQVFSSSQSYDSLGRIHKAFDASSGKDQNGQRGIVNVYNQFGHLTAINDAVNGKNYRRIIETDARGNVTAEAYGNGVTTIRDYDADTGRLTGIASANAAGSNIQLLDYEWDVLGNLTHRKDQSGGKNLQENFLYDNLNRLTSSTIVGGKVQTLNYDGLGNITYKSDVGSYSYGVNAGPHAVTQAGNTTYQYDANGNNISSFKSGALERTIAYTSFDKAKSITKGSHTTSFAYDPGRSRYKRVDNDKDGKVTTTYYIGSVELITRADGTKEYKRQIAGSALETISYKNGVKSEKLNFLHKDHLGSIDVITDAVGNVTESLSFDAWGLRRSGVNWNELSITQIIQQYGVTGSIASAIFPTTTRGYTGHEMLDEVGIIHMNGRIYDARLARFLQADPHIQAPSNTQSLNRYSYVWNNPLNKTDPSGYFAFGLFGLAKLGGVLGLGVVGSVAHVAVSLYTTHKFLQQLSPKVAQAVGIVVTAVSAYFCGPCSIGISAAYNAQYVYAQTGDLEAAFHAGGRAAATAAAFYAVGQGLGNNYAATGSEEILGSGLNATGFGLKVLSHGIIGGVSSVMAGGKFGHGFAAAGVTAAASGIAPVGEAGGPTVEGTIISALVGGTASKISGGKFANGAVTGAFSYVLNKGLSIRQKSTTKKTVLLDEKQSRNVFKIHGYEDADDVVMTKQARQLATDMYFRALKSDEGMSIIEKLVRTVVGKKPTVWSAASYGRKVVKEEYRKHFKLKQFSSIEARLEATGYGIVNVNASQVNHKYEYKMLGRM